MTVTNSSVSRRRRRWKRNGGGLLLRFRNIRFTPIKLVALVAALLLVMLYYHVFTKSLSALVVRSNRNKEGGSHVSPEVLVVNNNVGGARSHKKISKGKTSDQQVKRTAIRGGGKKKHHQQQGDNPSVVIPPPPSNGTFAIPNILIFTHSVDLLDTTFSANLHGEDIALRKNVLNTIKLHPQAKVRFLTDDDCIQSIRNVLGGSTPLVDFFKKESHGMYKADICRGAALYETGGLYFDVDLQARMSLLGDGGSSGGSTNSVIRPETKFVVPLVHRDSKHKNAFFQAFIGASPKNPIILRYLELFLKHYQGKIDVQGPLGVMLLRQAYHQVVQEDQQTDIPTQLWQEVLYRSQLFPKVPPPTWGKRRACKFVVVADSKMAGSTDFVVPFYSRVKGSRMCGGADTNKHG